jgi:hypothetical protein
VGGFRVVDFMTSQRSFNSQYFVNNVMTPPIAITFPQGRIPHARRLHLDLADCHVQFAKATEQVITQNQLLPMPHSSYSPNIKPSDFWLFAMYKILWRLDVRRDRTTSRGNH